MSGNKTPTKGRATPAPAASSAADSSRVPDPGSDEVTAELASALLASVSGSPEAEDVAPSAPAKEIEEPLDDEAEIVEPAAPEAAAETNTTTETDPAGESPAPPEAAPAVQGEGEDDTPAWAKKRFGEMSAQIRQLKEERDSLKQQAASPPAPAVAGPGDLELLAAESPEQLAQLRERYEQLEDFVEQHRDGYEGDPEKGLPARSREELATVRAEARRKLRAVAERGRQIELQSQLNAKAAELYPALREADSEESRAIATVLHQVPEIRRLPHYRLILADSLAGARARMREAQAAAAPKRTPAGAPLPGRPAAAPVRSAPPAPGASSGRVPATAPAARTQARNQAFDRALKGGGSERDIAQLIAASLG